MDNEGLFNEGESVGRGWIAKPKNSARREKFISFVAAGSLRSYSIANIADYRAKIAELASDATGSLPVDHFWKSVLPTRDLPYTKSPHFLRGFVAGCIGRNLLDSLPM